MKMIRKFLFPSCAVASTLALVFCGSSLGRDVAAGSTADPPDGRALYMTHCSGCHGPNGDGKGTTPLERPARSFKQGGFAFGDTPGQLLKTIASGIPGSNPMPGFKDVLTVEERRSVVAFVQTLLPERREVTKSESSMFVADRPLVVRGHLAGLGGGSPGRPRGLLVGMPGGLTFEYRVDEVRLLAVRSGGFVDRTDWGGRGGTPMSPLGKAVYLLGGGNPGATFSVPGPEEGKVVPTQFKGSWIRDDDAGLSGLLDAGSFSARVEEYHRPLVVPDAIGFARHFDILPDADGSLLVELMGEQEGSEWVHGRPGNWEVAGRMSVAPVDDTSWHVAKTSGGSFVCVRVESPKGSRLVQTPSGLRVLLSLKKGVPSHVVATLVLTNVWSVGHLNRFSREF